MYNLKKNNYHQKPKSSNIQTPLKVSQFIFDLLRDKFPTNSVILDPCCGKRSLLAPWDQFHYPVHGIDIERNSPLDTVLDFLTWDGIDTDFLKKIKPVVYKPKPQLILCNPPFNGYGNKLGSEVWLDKIIELFGKEVPIVLFVPSGFTLNMTLKSKRLKKFENGTYPKISSRITLPKNIFPEVVFHSEILIFNIKDLQPHYFYHE